MCVHGHGVCVCEFVCVLSGWVCIYNVLCKYICILVYVRVWVYAYVSVCSCGCLACIYIYLYVRLHATVFRTRPVRSELSYSRPGPDPDSCSLWIRYTGNSKTDPCDDPLISTDLCSEDQMAIRFRNCVISCECSFLCIYRYRYALHVALIISCDFLLYFISLITCTTSWDIHDCPLYSCSWCLLILALFHVLVVWRY